MLKTLDPQSARLVWFRDDLRTGDNPALAAAIAAGGPVAALYILDDDRDGSRPLGAAARWKLHGALEALAHDLASLAIPLILRRGAAAETLEWTTDRIGAGAIYWNRRYEPGAVCQDRDIKAKMTARGRQVESFNGALLIEPWQTKTAAGGPFRTFTPFYRAARRLGRDLRPGPAPKAATPWPKAPAQLGLSDTLADWELRPRKPDWAGGMRATWGHGEVAAKQRLRAFLDTGFKGYSSGRDIPSAEQVSAISPHLRFGEIGPRQARQAAADAAARAEGALDGEFEAYERELFWRDFSYNLLFYSKNLSTTNVQSRFDSFPWRDSARDLEAWRHGQTGYPIVDAGMRQLWRTGWMHNRVRMVVASFLTKHLLIDWRAGERWFWDTLVDADAASNPANWQWVAGCGADAAPYFRIFNPILQGQKFDVAGAYVRQWVPELGALPAKYLHAPWTAPPDILATACVRLGETYPPPCVDHKAARARALKAFAATGSAPT